MQLLLDGQIVDDNARLGELEQQELGALKLNAVVDLFSWICMDNTCARVVGMRFEKFGGGVSEQSTEFLFLILLRARGRSIKKNVREQY